MNLDYSAINWKNKPSTASPINATNLNQMDTEIGDAINALNNLSKSDIGLSNVDNTSDLDKPVSNAVTTALSDKVDKVNGKGLSTEDYSTEDKTKLAGIESGAEVNVQADFEESSSSADSYIVNNPFSVSNGELCFSYNEEDSDD